MFPIEQMEDNIADEKIHKHDFISIKTEKETKSICSTYGVLYCENCGKAVNDAINEPKKVKYWGCFSPIASQQSYLIVV